MDKWPKSSEKNPQKVQLHFLSIDKASGLLAVKVKPGFKFFGIEINMVFFGGSLFPKNSKSPSGDLLTQR